MSAKLFLPRCVVTNVYHAEKSGKDYLTLQDGEGTYNIGSGDLDLSKVPTLVPLSVEIVVRGFMFGRNQYLTATEFNFKPIATT